MTAADCCAAFNARVLRLKEATGLLTTELVQVWGLVEGRGLEERILSGDQDAVAELIGIVKDKKETQWA